MPPEARRAVEMLRICAATVAVVMVNVVCYLDIGLR